MTIKAPNSVEMESEDQKLAELVELCLQTRNFDKIYHISRKYIVREVERLLIQTKLKTNKEKQLSWQNVLPSIQKINHYFSERFTTNLIPDDLVASLTNFNTLIKTYTNITPPVLKLAFKTYFELRKIVVPKITTNESAIHSPLGRENPKKMDLSRDLMVYELGTKKKALKSQLQQKYDPTLIERILYIENLERSHQSNSSRIMSSEILRLRFLILGALFVLVSLTGLIFYERMLLPEVNDALSLLSMVFAISSAILGLVYYKLFYHAFRRK